MLDVDSAMDQDAIDPSETNIGGQSKGYAQFRDELEPEGDESEGAESGLSKAPMPQLLDVNLPEVELKDLTQEDKTAVTWVSRCNAV